MSRYDKCVCSDTRAKHDDNGICRVKSCNCMEFEFDDGTDGPIDAMVSADWAGGVEVHTSYGGH